MILELADGPRRKSKYITVDAYKRKTKVAAHKRRRPVLNSGDYHVYVPHHLSEAGRGLWVREDFFDGLSDNEWHSLMDELLEHDPELSELSGKKGRARRAEKKKVKAAKKKEKWERRQKRKDMTAASKAQKRLMKAGGKSGGGEGEDSGSSGGGGGNILDTIINKGTELVDKVKERAGSGGSASQDREEPEGAEGEENEGAPSKNSSGGFNIMGMEIPKPVAIGGGILLVGGIIYLATRKKK